MSPIALEGSNRMWSSYDYEGDSWIDLQSSVLNNLSLDPRAPQPQFVAYDGNYGDIDFSHLTTPFQNFSIKRCQGFVRCDMDIDAEVIGWVIGKNGSTIKELKNKTGCNMWVDQRALKLTITGPDARAVEHAAKSVEAYVAAAPIKAGAVEEAVTRSLDCPPHLLDMLGERTTIARIVKETRAQVVVNKKMARIIVRGGPHAVNLACNRVQVTINAALAVQSRGTFANAHSISLDRGNNDGDADEHLLSSTRSRAPSVVYSQDGSLPMSPGIGSGQAWSLFSGPTTFQASGKSPKISSSQASLQKLISPTDSYFTSFNFEDDTFVDGIVVPSYDVPLALGSSKSSASPSHLSFLSAAFKDKSLEVSALLNALKLSKYSAAFHDSEIDIDAMCLMSENDFAELDIPKGPRLKIMNALRSLSTSS